MKQAVFITGFNNWGKSEIIFNLFDGQKRFWKGYLYKMTEINFDVPFTVESHSNDDLIGMRWIEALDIKISRNYTEADNDQNLITALCASMEENNNFVELLTQPLFAGFDKLHIFLIENKWEHHARLTINNILQKGRSIPNANFITINADQNLTNDTDRRNAKMNQIRQELNRIFS